MNKELTTITLNVSKEAAEGMKLYEEQNKRKTEVFIDKLFCMMNEDVVDRAAFAIYEFFIVPAAEESDEKKDEVVLKMLAYFFYKLMEDEFPMTTVFYPINKIAEIIKQRVFIAMNKVGELLQRDGENPLGIKPVSFVCDRCRELVKPGEEHSFTVCPSCYEELKQYDICQPDNK